MVAQFTNPMEVAWAAMNRTLLKRFWLERPDEFANAARISDRVLVMNRGIHLVSCSLFYPPSYFQSSVSCGWSLDGILLLSPFTLPLSLQGDTYHSGSMPCPVPPFTSEMQKCPCDYKKKSNNALKISKAAHTMCNDHRLGRKGSLLRTRSTSWCCIWWLSLSKGLLGPFWRGP